jgi:hypothetical protein
MFKIFFSEHRSFHEINVETYGRNSQAADGNIIRRMHFTRWEN